MSNNKKYNINLILDKSDEIIEIQIIFNILRVKLTPTVFKKGAE